MKLVIDSSVALTWCFEDERTQATLDLLDQVIQEGAVAPTLWPLEVLNALTMAERRKRITAAQRHTLANLLRDLPITLDVHTAEQSWNATSRLAESHRLTLYDASYLELAQRLGLPLATFDKALRSAAEASGVALAAAVDDV